MDPVEMCNSCQHVGYCMAAMKIDHWCGNWIIGRRVNDMEKCPKCGRGFPKLLALSRTDNKTMICDECGTREALGAVPPRTMSPQEKTRAAVYATGNRWAIENFNATHN